MRLEMGNIYIKDIQFADTSKIEDGILYVDKGAVKAVALEDEHIKTVTFDIAKPGESVRITPVKDVIEPRVKVEGKGGDMKKPFGIFWMFVFTICLSGCWRRIIVEWKKDISHMKWNFLFKCFIGCLNIRKDFAMSWEICSWSVSVMGITDSSLPRYTLLI